MKNVIWIYPTAKRLKKMLIERNDIYELITNQSFKTINLGDQKDKIIKNADDLDAFMTA